MAEKAAVLKSKNRFLKLLPKAAAAAVTFQSIPFSPNKEKRLSEKLKSKGSSGANDKAMMVSIIPVDALHSRSRNSSLREPTSPKVSCMGQVKHKKKLCSLINTNYTYRDSVLPPLDHLSRMVQSNNNSKQGQQKPAALKLVKSFDDGKKKKKPMTIKHMFSRVPSGRRKSDVAIHGPDDHRASSCSLSQMRRISSGRNFDWTTVAEVVDNFDKEEVKLSKFAVAPEILQECKAVSLEPRKEVNLWKRRTMAQPSPLELKN